MSVAPNDKVRLTSEFTLPSGSIVQNIYHFRANFAAAQADATVINSLKTWVEDVLDNIEAAIKSTVTVNLHQVDVEAWDGTKWEITANVGTFTPSFTPTETTADIMPNPDSPFIVFNTSRPKTKGRKFMWGFTELNFNGSYLQTALVTALVAAATDMLANGAIDLLNYLVPGVPRSASNTWFDFVNAVVTNIAGTQRRRRPGVGA